MIQAIIVLYTISFSVAEVHVAGGHLLSAPEVAINK